MANLGKVAVTPKGEYDPTAHYERLDVVSYEGSSYMVLKDCTGVTPAVGEYYMLSAAKGGAGGTQDADPPGTAAAAVSQHNTDTTAHNDLRQAMRELADRVNAALDSDDTTLDQMSEVVAYIKSNKTLIDAITTSKVSVADIVNDLVTNVTDKPLSAAQGVVLKGLIDEIRTLIPESGSGISVTGATVGQTIRVAAVDDDGVPTAWEPVDFIAEREWSLLGEIDVSVIDGGSIELTGLDNFTEFYATWDTVINESTSASGYNAEINGTIIAMVAIPIQKAGAASNFGWMYTRYNGLGWEFQRSNGATTNSNVTLSNGNGMFPYNHILNVGKAVEFKLKAPELASYRAVSGIIKIYGR